MDSSPLELLSSRYLPEVEAELRLAVSISDDRQYKGLQDILAYHMGWKGEEAGPEARGKRIRPLLVLLTNTACGGNWKTAIPAAAAVELVHNFSLIHDDIEDNSPTRRGRPTVWSKWGIPQAINAGDAMFTLAHLEVLKLAHVISPAIALEAVELLHHTCLHLTQGQFLDLSYENHNILSETAYWPMVQGKTAALLGACTELGAITAQATPEHRSSFRSFGQCLGLAFQVQDDYLGIWGKPDVTGKSIASDLVAGKKTLPVLWGLGQQGQFYTRWTSHPVSMNDVCDVAALLEAEGGRAYTLATAEQLSRQALQALEDANPDDLAGDALRHLTNKLLQRQI